MTISSRTPEGDRNRCPICGHRLRLEPSIDTRDGPCPRCGHLLWFGEPTAPESVANQGLPQTQHSKTRAKSYEVFIMRLGNDRFGPIRIEFQRYLIWTVGELHRLGDFPRELELNLLVAESQSWGDLITKLGQYPYGDFVRAANSRLEFDLTPAKLKPKRAQVQSFFIQARRKIMAGLKKLLVGGG